MKSFALPLMLITFCVSAAHAQKTAPLKKILELQMDREGGANGASVAWHPVQKKYYAAMAGNISFPMGVYDVKGKLLSPLTQKTYFDVRGLWYNPLTKTLQTNGYADFGWAEYKLNAKGFPDTVSALYDGMNQPDEQNVGAFDPKKKVVYFLNEEGNLDMYDYTDGVFTESLDLHLGVTENEDDGLSDNYDVIGDYNITTVIFTGIAGAEIGLMNYINKEIELYNLKNGYLTRKFSLPDDAPAESRLNFAFSNSIYWLFDRTERIWRGYK